MSAEPGRPPRITVVPVEPGFAEIMSGKDVVGVAMADFYWRWTVRLFTAPSQRQTDAVEPFTLMSLRAVRSDVRGRVASDGPWWSDQAATG
jgi:hypothetical protein